MVKQGEGRVKEVWQRNTGNTTTSLLSSLLHPYPRARVNRCVRAYVREWVKEVREGSAGLTLLATDRPRCPTSRPDRQMEASL